MENWIKDGLITFQYTTFINPYLNKGMKYKFD